ncbi:MAG: 50S ribosomal protein L35 [Anaerovibrio sp.]|jgi:large subunit ribosomal protein L35|uniref:Large ribosomal subunit protein bL35 n=3 Tax=Anaerovibrio TaxID=82373 RepID=A0A0B2K2G7_9FIRM|nr:MULTISPECIES: 50S ribosomal protein L35 [Anaerovibrio]KHM52966.1 50S ribosomal protein L35 [Anaerovibrio lipolyticus]MBE6105606.1 50S ribosomal protein L35 [Anaerovibrio lipolyticus]MBO5588741.1 50S ribosomal protein L35 [Anaerovibrio sp.]MBO6245549.1 50S ribosomal protein L35 [Anaerovibrio sp.]ORU00212.1 LSU ribosomal protein L35p [Anaerovibrio sp. JC8]
MQKMKTRRAAAKRFTVTGTGEIRRNKAYKRHILEKKSPKRKRNMRKAALLVAGDYKREIKCLPYA